MLFKAFAALRNWGVFKKTALIWQIVNIVLPKAVKWCRMVVGMILHVSSFVSSLSIWDPGVQVTWGKLLGLHMKLGWFSTSHSSILWHVFFLVTFPIMFMLHVASVLLLFMTFYGATRIRSRYLKKARSNLAKQQFHHRTFIFGRDMDPR